MWSKTNRLVRAAWIMAAYCFVLVAVYAWKPAFTNASQPVRGVSDPVIALQHARTVDEVDNVLSDSPSADREVMRIKQYIQFALIPGYVALAIVIAESFARRKRLRLLIRLAELQAVLGGVASIWESVVVLRIVDTKLSDTTREMLAQLHFVSEQKWILLPGALAFLGAIVVLSASGKWRIVGVIADAAAIATMAGLWQNTWLMWGGMMMITALLLMAATLKLLTHEPVTETPIQRPIRRSV